MVHLSIIDSFLKVKGATASPMTPLIIHSDRYLLSRTYKKHSFVNLSSLINPIQGLSLEKKN